MNATKSLHQNIPNNIIHFEKVNRFWELLEAPIHKKDINRISVWGNSVLRLNFAVLALLTKTDIRFH
jgi:hypothetical protein